MSPADGSYASPKKYPMRFSTVFHPNSPGSGSSRAGITLVMTLLALALLTILLLAMLQGTTHQLHGAENTATLAREKMLADSTVALVIGQIQQASTQTNQAWISQPGLLRTYDTTATRKPTASYKLYSAAQMTDTSGTLAFLTTDVPSDWNSTANRNLYTDLNTAVSTPGLFSKTIYPILDPAAFTNVEGVSADTGHSVEMPVMWLYQLQDGTLGPASNGTKANPIIARLAFWTDDETSKINLNTAGHGSPWNRPRTYSSDDVAWSTSQPAVGEYSRYPGHPAMTSLDAVFGANNGALTSTQLLGLTPRYAFGGSQFGTVPTTAGQSVTAKMDRLYASLDELYFGTSLDSSSQRMANPITTDQINAARFVLTAHSVAPETTLLGEPRVAIWPVSDKPTDSTRTSAVDRAIETAATVGTRNYFFQRHNPLSATDDLDAAVVPGNAQLFSELVARGDKDIPGYGAHFSAKYTGASWTQLLLEITDFIRGLNAVDPSPAPFVPYASGDSSNVGRGFIIPLTTTYQGTTLRGIGRCPTLSSLTLVFYVCGYGFDDGTTIDYDATPDDAVGTSWNKNFAVASKTNRWSHVTSALVRAFVIPCTFQPSCAYPEVSDACTIQISGLNGITVSSGAASGDFGFAATTNTRLLSDAQTVLPAERAWGGNEGPLAWRAAAIDAMSSTGASYPFAGTKAFAVPLASGATPDPLTNGPSWPLAWLQSLVFNGVTGLTVHIRDKNGVTLQTLSVDLPAFSANPPTTNGECDHADGSTPAASSTDWTTNASKAVAPSYYMCLHNRLLATQLSRAVLLQAGDISRSVEANTDLRVTAGLSSVPSKLFSPHPNYLFAPTNAQGGSHAHNLRFADGTSVCFASGATKLISSAGYSSATATFPVHDWRDGSLLTIDPLTLVTAYTYFTQPACSVMTGTTFVTMKPILNVSGDWDTGLGFSADGAQVNLPDSGTSFAPAAAYFSLTSGKLGAATQRTPNALIPSPVIFGSLPAGINPTSPAQSEPWRTLLFCAYPAAESSHPGASTPPDYLLLDHFWMPVVEPYPISTCLATTGKINLNNQIAPFTWLHRRTAFHALLSDLRLPAIPLSSASTYKTAATSGFTSIWKSVDENATITNLESRFATGDAYLSESEICTVPIVPTGVTYTSPHAFWNGTGGGGQLTGDNLRELPYAQLYGRLTTRSNSYTIHVRVQVLQKLPNDPHQDIWNEDTDQILGDWRGSYEIERYLDPAATAPTAGQSLGPYHFRIISSRRFAP
jgi:uncharacterized protein (TIGR02600 family)